MMCPYLATRPRVDSGMRENVLHVHIYVGTPTTKCINTSATVEECRAWPRFSFNRVGCGSFYRASRTLIGLFFFFLLPLILFLKK